MSNVLGAYNEIYFAQTALKLLENALGMAARVYRGYEGERAAQARDIGDTITIRKPSTFTAQNAPSSAQDLNTESTSITLDQWKEVKFALTDKELSYTQERMVAEHIRPAAYALANAIDQALAGLYVDIPWVATIADTSTHKAAPEDITAARRLLFENGVPLDDPAMIHLMVNGKTEAEFLSNAAFSQYQGAGDTGVATQLRGTLGQKFGIEVFANQNTPVFTPATLVDTAGAVKTSASGTANDGSAEKGSTNLDIKSMGADTDGVKPGNTFVIAGNTQRYAVTAVATVSSNEINVTFTPALVADYAANDVVTFDNESTYTGQNLCFHRNAFALVTAPLSTLGNGAGARMATVTSPDGTISLRSRIYYTGDTSKVSVALDVLYGFKTLDPNMACRLRSKY